MDITKKLFSRENAYLMLILLTISTNAAAEDGGPKIDSGDTAWVLAAAALVLFMTPGLGLFYGGMVRRKNVVSMLTQCFIVICLVSIQWALFGYSIAFGPDTGNGLIGDLSWAGLSGVGQNPNTDYAATIPHIAFMMFQLMFAIITPALIYGAFADRIKFSTMIVFTLLWTTIVYDPVCHWVWGVGGILGLAKMGALDFAGGTVVHITAGISALAAAIVIGKRKGYKTEEMAPGNVPMIILGGGILWFGWFGFNAGSALGANSLAASAFMTTNMAAAAAGLAWMTISWMHMGKPNAAGIVTGAVAGLVAITPASGFVGPMESIIIGILAGLICYIAMFLKNKYASIDDSLDVFACHGVGGTIGAIATGLFCSSTVNSVVKYNGLLAGGDITQLIIQVQAVAASMIYSFAMTLILLKLLDKTMGLRVTDEEEVAGLDITQHGEKAYT